MKDLNRWTGTGRLVADPEPWGRERTGCKFRIAVNRGNDKNGKDKGAYFLNCQAWDMTAEIVMKYGAKGRKVLVTDASIFVSEYNKDDEKRYFTGLSVRGVQFMDPPRRQEPSPQTEAEPWDGKMTGPPAEVPG